jgi:hypothetical protein
MQDATALQTERQQLVNRIAEIDALIAAANSSTEYMVAERSVTEFGKERSVFRVTRNGAPVAGHEYRDRKVAEDVALGMTAIPEDYSLGFGPAGRLGWKYMARRNGKRIAEHEDIHRVIKSVQEDVADRPRRAALAAERRAEASARASIAVQVAASRPCGHCGAPVAPGAGLVASTGLACSTECYDELS